ncbi:ferroxidase fet3, partial [Linderina pennispora]
AHVAINWDIGYVMANRDGIKMRRVIGVNGQTPVPPIEVDQYDRVALTVHNSLDQPTTVHTHGFFQNGTSYLDGAAMVSECGIPPGDSYTYHIDTSQAGTYWIHGHDQGQNADGLRTSFIVRDKVRPYEYDGDYTLALEDWYTKEFPQKESEILDPANRFPPPASFPTGLINGYHGNDAEPIRFEPGKTYRIRVINMGTTESFMFSIPGHTLEVIEADGYYSLPYPVDVLNMGPGQRYSALVKAHDSNRFNYRYNATLYAAFLPNVNGRNPQVYTGLVEYKKRASVKKVPFPGDYRVVKDIELVSKDREPILRVSRSIDLHIADQLYTNGQSHTSFNNITYIEPRTPSLFSMASMGRLAMDPEVYGPQTHAIVLRHLEAVEFNIINNKNLDHPIHLHGHNFQVVEYGPLLGLNTTTGPALIPAEPPRFQRSGPFPMRRDTVLAPPFGYVKIRFVADNPGAWLMHCHVMDHMFRGMQVTVIEAPDVLQHRQKIPEELLEHCDRLGMPRGGNGAGNKGYDFSGLPKPLTLATVP